MRTNIRFIALTLFLTSTPSLSGQTGYPHASLDQATVETKNSLDIERFAGLDDAGLEREYNWALEMAALCQENLPELCARDPNLSDMAIEFQRHAGRTSRYRGFGEQAIRDYERAIEYVHASAPIWTELRLHGDWEAWERNVLKDIATTYLFMRAEDTVAAITHDLMDRIKATGDDPAPEGWRLAVIAEQHGDFAEAVKLRERAVTAQREGREFLARHADLVGTVGQQSWGIIVGHPEVQRRFAEGKESLSGLREAYCDYGRSFRIDGQLEEAAYALETATLTPWHRLESYRPDLDFEVDREWAFLWLDQGKTTEALEKAEECLEKYSASMHPSEKMEMLDLVGRAKERLGDVEGALEKVQEAIGIVEEKRANLTTDEFKQSFSSGYAPLYRRALELSIRLNEGRFGNKQPPPDLPLEGGGVEQIEKTFEWSERVKGRAMLDTLGRYGVRMARAATHGDTAEMLAVRDQAARVIGIRDLQHARWWPAETAVLEFAYGNPHPTSPLKKEGSSATNPPPSNEGGAQPYPPPSKGGGRGRVNSAKTNPHPTSPLKGEALRTRVYVWVVTPKMTSFRRLEASAEELDDLSSALAEAMQPRREPGEAWVEAAAQLYEHAIAPIADQLHGIKRLIIVADGHLRTIPFEVLISARDAYAAVGVAAGAVGQSPSTAKPRHIPHRLLIEDYAISYAPSATVLDAISREQRPEKWEHALWAFASTRFGKRVDCSTSDPHPTSPSKGGGVTPPPVLPLEGGGLVSQAEAKPDKAPQSYRDILRAAKALELEDLRDTQSEVAEVARCFGVGVDPPFVDLPNMKDMLLSASREGILKRVRFLHFATHAFVDPARPYLAGLMLCPPFPNRPPSNGGSMRGDPPPSQGGGRGRVSSDPTNPHPASPLEGEGFIGARRPEVRPELLTLDEIGRLDLTSELVVLSACKSLGDRVVDGDWLSGLARSFLVAGASGVLCTLWEAGDHNSALAMPAIYQAMIGSGALPDAVDVPLALQRYKTARLRSPKYGHPALWSPFVYNGRVGSSKGP